jgi:hypothetical protein
MASPSDRVLNELVRVSDVWPEQPPEDRLHVFVMLPRPVQESPTLVNAIGVCFIRLFALAQDI